MTSNRNIKLSKYLCFILRHKPETIGIELDENGKKSIRCGRRVDAVKL
ncbi:MAG: hypothetical protein GXO83_08010 [Chlorobi bacterium]|nr:hypothetical protein [Chlorobiota bacterium]